MMRLYLSLAIVLMFEVSCFSQSLDPYSSGRSAVNGKGTLLAVASDDSIVRVWDVSQNKLIHTIATTLPALSVAIDEKGERLLTGTHGTRSSPEEYHKSKICCWSLQDSPPQLLWETNVIGGCQGLAFCKSSNWVAAICVYSRLCFLDGNNGALQRVWTENGNGYWDFSIVRGEKILVTAGQQTRFWDLEKHPIEQTELPLDYWPASEANESFQQSKPWSGSCSLACTPDGREAYAIGWFKGTSGRAWDLGRFVLGSNRAPDVVATAMGTENVLPRCIALLPIEDQLVIGFDEGRIEFRSRAGVLAREFQSQDRESIRSIHAVNNGKQLSVVTQNGMRVYLLDLSVANKVKLLFPLP